MTKVKICGITNLDDALSCASLGADFLGFVFYQKSPRFIPPDAAASVAAHLPPGVLKVGVFVNEKPQVVRRTAESCGLDFLQFHGDETPAYLKKFKEFRVIRAVRVKGRRSLLGLKDYTPEFFLFDTFAEGRFGGTGEPFDWRLLESLKKLKIPFFVSGGLTPDNVGRLLERIRPYAVDVSSGVEQGPGKKDRALVRKFIEAVKGPVVLSG